MAPKTHRHRARGSAWVGAYSGPVAWPENRAAHGNVVYVYHCACGAERRTNVNGPHIERGDWFFPQDAMRPKETTER